MGQLTQTGASRLLNYSFARVGGAIPATPLHADLLDNSGSTILNIGSGVPKIPSLDPIGFVAITDTGAAKRVHMDQDGYTVGVGVPSDDYRYVAISDDSETAWWADDKGSATAGTHTISGTVFDDGDLDWTLPYVPMSGAAYNAVSMVTGKMYPTPEYVSGLCAAVFRETADNLGAPPYAEPTLANATWTVSLLTPAGVDFGTLGLSGYVPQTWANSDVDVSTSGGYYLLNKNRIEFSPTGNWPDIGFVEVRIGGTRAWVGKITTITGVQSGYSVRIEANALKLGFATTL